MKCSLCERETSEEESKTFDDLSPAEKALLGRDQLVYCRPCHGVLTDPASASSIMISMVEVKLRQLGIVVSPETLEKYRARLDGLLRKSRKLV
jgi:hypothetical protein